MKICLVDNATDTVSNIIKVDPENIPDAPVGFRYEESAGNIGDVLINGEWVTPAPIITPAEVNVERNRRLQSGITFNGVLYQSLDEDIQRITGAATLAGFAVGAGSPVGNLRWANPDQDFGWIATDNSVTPMDAQTMFAFGQAAAANESAHVFAARTIKNMDPIPVDFTDDKWWP